MQICLQARVNAAAPGITKTDTMKTIPDLMIKQSPLHRLGQPEDIANAFAELSVDSMAKS